MPQSCCFSRRSGLSLIEVVASIVLLVSLFVLLLKGWKVHALQIRESQKRLEAIRLLDQQLVHWFVSEQGPPMNQSGGFHSQNDSKYYWTSKGITRTTSGLPKSLSLLQVQVFDSDDRLCTSIELIAKGAVENSEGSQTAMMVTPP